MLDPDTTEAAAPSHVTIGSPHLASDIVAFTRRASRQYNRARSALLDILIDLYSAALALGCIVAIAASFVIALRNQIADLTTVQPSLVDDRWQVLPADALWVLLTYGGLAGIAVLAGRLGPVTASPAEAAWWLPLPLDRRPLVLPGFLRRTAAVGVAAVVGYLPFSFLTALDRVSAEHLNAAATFGALASTAVAGAAVLQLAPQHQRRHQAALLASLLPGAVLPFLASAGWPLPAALVGAAALLAYVGRRIGWVPGAELTRGGAVSGHVGASVFFLDANELQRALAAGRRGTSRRRQGARFFARPVRGAFGALVRSDVVAYLRLRPPLAGPLLSLAACVGVVLIDPALPALLQIAVMVIAGCITAAGTGTIMRRAAIIPELDSLLPLEPWLVRLSRILMPALALGCWMGGLTGVLAALGAAGPLLFPLGMVAGIGMAVGTLRAATRPPTDWTRPAVETPFGPVPRDQMSSMLHGTDMTVLAMVPVMLAVYLGSVYPVLILAQLAITAGALLYHVRMGSVRS
ncbi:DUF6297 family protein [Arthrobacter sp. D3-16]